MKGKKTLLLNFFTTDKNLRNYLCLKMYFLIKKDV